MQVAVAGGTGLLGSAACRALAAAGHAVRVLSRHEPARGQLPAGVEWRHADVLDGASIVPALEGVDAVVDAVQFPNSPIENPKKGYTFERFDLGGTRNLVDAASTAGVTRFIGLSGMGAAADARYHWLRFKYDEEEHIRASGLTYTIFRPSWVYGPGDVSLNRFLGFARFLPFVPVIGRGSVRLNPLFVEDLGAHVVAALSTPGACDATFEVGGPEVLTMDQIIRTALDVSGRKRLLLHQPKSLMKAVATIAQHLPGRPLTPDAIDFITMDPIADITAVQRVFQLPLTPLRAALGTYLTHRRQ